MTNQPPTIEEILKELQDKSSGDYVLWRVRDKAKQAIKQWILDEVIGEDEPIDCPESSPCLSCMISMNNNYHKEHMRRKVEEA